MKKSGEEYCICDNRGLTEKVIIRLNDEVDALLLTSHMNGLNEDYKECVVRKNIIIEKLKPYQELSMKYYMPSSIKFAGFVDDLVQENNKLKEKNKALEDTINGLTETIVHFNIEEDL